jgi:aryl-alcohol dehydrogenase-like predicted oxidoreductase
LRDPVISSVIVGATRPERINDNAVAADLDIASEVFARMDALLAPVVPHEPYVS